MAKKYYKLRRSFWNGKALVPVGEIYPFEEGTQPKSAVEVKAPEEDAPEPKASSKPAKPAEK